MACSVTVTDVAGPGGGAAPSMRLDLRGTPCPLNLVRARLTLEGLAPGAWLELLLDAGEAEQSVSEGLRQAGHQVEPHGVDRTVDPGSAGVCLLIRRHDG